MKIFSLFDRLHYFRFVPFCLPLLRLYNCNDTGENKKTGKSYQYEYGTYFQAVFLRIHFIRLFIVSHPHGHGKNAIHQPQKEKGEIVANSDLEQKREDHEYTSDNEKGFVPGINVQRRTAVVHIENLSFMRTGVIAVC